MPRSVSGTLSTLLQASETHPTLALVYTDGTVKKFSNTPLAIAKGTFVQHLKTVSEIKQTLSRAISRCKAEIQNVDRAMGLDIASSARLLENAEAVVGRYYSGIRDAGLNEWKSLFTGRVMTAEADEETATLEIISDITAAGQCVATRGLADNCPRIYKDFRCGATSSNTTCNKNLKGIGSCTDNANTDHFEGWMNPDNPTPPEPPPGDPGGGGIGGGTCFTGDTLIWTPNNDVPISEIRKGDIVWAFDENTKQLKASRVLNIMRHEINRFYSFDFEGIKLNVTPEHRLLTAKGFQAADSLGLAAKVFTHEGEWLKRRIKSFKWNTRKPVEVFNLEIEKYHTYFANRVAVHNEKLEDPPNY